MKFLILTITIFIFSCQKSNEIKEEKNNPKEEEIVEKELEKEKPVQLPKIIKPTKKTNNQFIWKNDYQIKDAIINRIGVPEGYQRVELEKGSFGDWLRHLPLKKDGSAVKYYNGNVKYKNVHHSVIDIDTGNKDLQQCADAVMRLKSEFHFSKQEFDQIHFNYTSGDLISFEDWRKGKKPIVRGNSVSFSPFLSQENNSYSNFKKYLQQIFTYAGTASLSKELKSVDVNDIRIGDVFIQGGHPGHAVIVIDIAENDLGKKIFMIAQSYMPAQDMHILQNFNQTDINPWYTTDFDELLNTPEWTFNRADLKRFM